MAAKPASRYFRRVARSSGGIIGLLLLIALSGSFLLQGAYLRVLVNFFIIVIVVTGLQTFVGNAGIVSYGHATFVGVGAYVTSWVTVDPVVKEILFPAMPVWLTQMTLGFLPAVFLSILAGGLVGALIGLVVSRMKETAIAMSSLALLVIAHGVFVNSKGMTNGTTGVYALPVHTTLWIAVGAASLAIVVAVAFKYSRVGLKLQATRDDPLAASTTGVSVIRVRYIAWVLSAAISGAAGSIWAQFNLGFSPNQFYWAQVFAALSMLVIGGLATVSGAVVGAGAVTLVYELARGVEERGNLLGLAIPRVAGLTQMILAVATLLILIYRREGILGWSEIDVWASKGWRWVLRRWRFSRKVPGATEGGR